MKSCLHRLPAGLALGFFLTLPAAAATGESLVESTATLMLQLGFIVVAAWLGGRVFERLRLPSVLGELLAGVLIGPYLLGTIALPSFPHGIFPPGESFPVSPELYSLAALASIILLFVVGIETDLETFLRFSVAGTAVGLGGVIVSFILGDLTMVLLAPVVLGQSVGFGDPMPLMLGAVSTATSVGISARMLSERGKIGTPEGTTILAGAVIDDVLGIIVLAIVIGIIGSGTVQWSGVALVTVRALVIWLGFTVIGLSFANRFSRWLKGLPDRETMALLSFAVALFAAGVFERFGLAMIIGAYVTGLSLSKTDVAYLIREKMTPLQRLFVPVFFCIMGMLVNPLSFADPQVLLLGAAYTGTAVVAKIAGCGLPAFALNFNLRGATRIGVGMVPRGEVALIVAGIGLSAGALTGTAFDIAIFMTFITTLLTPPVFARLLRGDGPVLRKEPPTRHVEREIRYEVPSAETRDLMLARILAAFEGDGYLVYRLEIPHLVYHMRRDTAVINMRLDADSIVFTCDDRYATFVHTLVYEEVAEVEYIIHNLKSFRDKNALGRRLFSEHGQGAAATTTVAMERVSQVREHLHVSAVRTHLRGDTKREVIEELLDLLIAAGEVPGSQRETALHDLLEREDIMSTGMQDGIALPHARTEAATRVVAAFGVHPMGIAFGSLDQQPARIFLLILAPKTAAEPYLQFLARMTGFLTPAENRERVFACGSNQELYELLVRPVELPSPLSPPPT